MEGSHHCCVSSSTSIKPSSTPKVLSAASSADENDQSISLQNSRKSATTKHFMSPTISTASKAIAPRKKILAERNEISDTHVQKSPSFNFSDDTLSLNDDSSLKPYHPLANYPSPRPEFLRYKPNRRREIILRHEKKAKEEANLASASQEVNEVDEREDEVVEEEEEEREGFWRRVFKFVLVLLVLVFSTLYISSMNSPRSSTLQAVESLKEEWYLKIHEGAYKTMMGLRGEDYFLKAMQFKEIVKLFGGAGKFVNGNMDLVKINETFIDEGFEEEEMVEDVNLAKVEEMGDNPSAVVELQGGDTEVFGEMVVLQAGESDNVEGFYQMLENIELKGAEEKVEKLESFEDNQMPIMSYAFQLESEVSIEPAQEVNNLVDGGLPMVESEMANNEPITSSEVIEFDTLSSEGESDLKVGLLEQIETDTIFKAVIGVTLFFSVIVSLILAFNIKKKRNIREKSFPVINPCSNESMVMEKCNSVIPKETEECVKGVDSFSSSMSLVDSTAKDSKDMYKSRGPAIELLGEFEVGRISYSLRSCGMKSRMEESEVSSHSVSLQKEFGSWSKNRSVCGEAHSDFSEFSAMNSLSYGCFTPEKKIPKKEDGGGGGEAKKVLITPVRRSSRIRNRAITSP